VVWDPSSWQSAKWQSAKKHSYLHADKWRTVWDTVLRFLVGPEFKHETLLIEVSTTLKHEGVRGGHFRTTFRSTHRCGTAIPERGAKVRGTEPPPDGKWCGTGKPVRLPTTGSRENVTHIVQVGLTFKESAQSRLMFVLPFISVNRRFNLTSESCSKWELQNVCKLFRSNQQWNALPSYTKIVWEKLQLRTITEDISDRSYVFFIFIKLKIPNQTQLGLQMWVISGIRPDNNSYPAGFRIITKQNLLEKMIGKSEWSAALLLQNSI